VLLRMTVNERPETDTLNHTTQDDFSGCRSG
jgi:hypothetical protein